MGGVLLVCLGNALRVCWWLVYLCVSSCYGVDAVARLVVTFVVVGGLLFASRVGLFCDLYDCCVL